MEYKGVINGPTDKDVLFDGKKIAEKAYTPTSQSDQDWGYNGAGPSNTAESILSHAKSQCDVDPDRVEGPDRGVDPQLRKQFTTDFVRPLDKGEEWSIELEEVCKWIKNNA